ncbi:MAG: radical SAM protein, partial [bacterium]|nr:radical SAM protein [bacterium]
MEERIVIKLLERVRSKTDKTIKFVFLSGGQVIEFSYINKDDGKDIICAPTQTACNLGCKFCFLSDIKLPVRNLEPYEIAVPIYFIIKELRLLEKKMPDTALLISYMGCGEPLLNIDNVIEASRMIRNQMGSIYKVVRFAVASLIPAASLMEKFIEAVKKAKLKMKFHLSLHSADHMVRKGLMPSAELIEESVELTEKFVRLTENSAEIHYALIRNINDRDCDAEALVTLLTGRPISVKFLAYNAKPSVDFEESERVIYFRAWL